MLHSANLRGEYEAHPLGGLARRASYAQAVKAEVDGLVHVDAGDSLLPAIASGNKQEAGQAQQVEPPPPASEIERRARLLVEGLGRLKLDAFTPGETDLSLGPARLKAMAQKARLPVLAANLIDRKGKPLFQPHKLIQAGGVRVGLFGVLSLSESAVADLGKAGLSLIDVAGAAQGATSVLREQGAEIVVGLFHLAGGLAEARKLGKELVGLDVMVLGHGAENLSTPVLVASGDEGATFAVEAFERGKLLGRLDLHQVDGDVGFVAAGAGTGSWAAHQLVPLGPQIVSDEGMLAFIKPYIDENRRRAAKKLPVGLSARAGSRGELAQSSDEGWTYASSTACGMCHKPAAEQFASTAHAFALQTLERKGRERDPECLRCHTTGFDRKGGTRNLQTAVAFFGNVGCESCHGPSVSHIRVQNKTGTVRKVPESVCLECHKPDHSPEPFDYAAAMKEVLGPGHGG